MSDDKAKASDVYREQLTRLPQLADARIQKNIRDEIQRLKKSPSWDLPVGRSSETLVKYADLRIVLVVMKKGSHIEGHHADGPISVHGLQGRIRLNFPSAEDTELGAGDLLVLERSIQHEIEALEESAFLLTISWPKAGTAAAGR